MVFPDIALQSSPVPEILVVISVALDCPAPETEEKVGDIQSWKVHDIEAKTFRNRECSRETTENTWLTYASVLTSSCILSLVRRVPKRTEAPIVLFDTSACDRIDIDVIVITACNMVVVRLEASRIVVWF